MSNFYLNHSELLKCNQYNFNERIIEISKLKNKISNEKFYIYQYFWDIKIDNFTIQQIIIKVKDISSVIDSIYNGPFFYKKEDENYDNIYCKKANIQEDDFNNNINISEDNFHNNLLKISFKDNNKNIISLNDESFLIYNNYLLTENDKELKIINFIGESELDNYFNSLIKFNSINEVFDKIKKDYQNIIILKEAEKSAEKYNFGNNLVDVYNTIINLTGFKELLQNDETEYNLCLWFKAKTNFDVSKESTPTVGNKRLKELRKFKIDEKRTELFEWHIKIGLYLRIHFFIDKNTSLIYIGHCGKHLPT